MYYLSDFCCICLCNNKILQQLSTTDNDNITYLSKIISSVPEMSHSVMNDQRLICKECCDNINITYKFRQQCLRSKTMIMDCISQLRSVSNVSGKISICLTDFRLQKDETFVKSEDKRVIDTLSLVNEIKSEPSEGHFIDVNCLQMEEILKEDYVELVDYAANPLHIEVENEVETNIDSVNQIIKYSPVLFDNQEKELINKSNFDIKNKVANENLNSLNGIKTELNEINVFDSLLIENMIIKTEVENYIDENNDFSFDGELNRNKIVANFFYECILCEIAFTQSDALEAHMKVHAAEQDNVCTMCNQIFADAHVLSEHMKIHMVKQRYVCSICKKTFTYLSSLNSHLINHKGEPHESTVCNKTFIQSGHLKKHMRIHAGERLYECTICTKTFIQISHLKQHMGTHTGERPYECTVCKKTFPRTDNLNIHMRTHTGERPYECTVCKKAFIQSAHLKAHMGMHSEERRFECIECKKTFTRSGYLNKHMRTHTGERPYECTMCKKTFIRLDQLTIHMRTHIEEQPHECKTCNKRFILRGNLERHMRTHAGI